MAMKQTDEGTGGLKAADHWTDDLEHVVRVKGLIALVEERLEADWSLRGRARIDEICHYAVLPGNKLLRPILLLESAGAVGGDVEQLVPAAAGAEAGHVASLVHDDIIDGDQVRRGRPAVHAAFGVDDAIVAGDMLIFYLFLGLAACGSRGVAADRVASAMEAVAQAGLDMCRGQSLEAALCATFTCDVPSYITMVRLKTSALFRAACRSGAILAGANPTETDALGRYGDLLGVAFQIWDDLLAYTSDAETMGKAATSDLVKRRLTLPFLMGRQMGGPRMADQLNQVLLGDGDIEQRFAVLHRLLHEVGAVDAAIDAARDYASCARGELEILPDTPSRATLGYLADAAVDRCA
jgi:geranylgeranyl diphosphate synthase type I